MAYYPSWRQALQQRGTTTGGTVDPRQTAALRQNEILNQYEQAGTLEAMANQNLESGNIVGQEASQEQAVGLSNYAALRQQQIDQYNAAREGMISQAQAVRARAIEEAMAARDKAIVEKQQSNRDTLGESLDKTQSKIDAAKQAKDEATRQRAAIRAAGAAGSMALAGASAGGSAAMSGLGAVSAVAPWLAVALQAYNVGDMAGLWKGGIGWGGNVPKEKDYKIYQNISTIADVLKESDGLDNYVKNYNQGEKISKQELIKKLLDESLETARGGVVGQDPAQQSQFDSGAVLKMLETLGVTRKDLSDILGYEIPDLSTMSYGDWNKSLRQKQIDEYVKRYGKQPLNEDLNLMTDWDFWGGRSKNISSVMQNGIPAMPTATGGVAPWDPDTQAVVEQGQIPWNPVTKALEYPGYTYNPITGNYEAKPPEKAVPAINPYEVLG